VFLMDEPLSNLDAKLRVQTRAEIARLHQRLGTTIIYVTHDQVEAMTMGDRIAVMSAGILQQVGPPQELYERPTNKFVAGFIGSPSMNFINVSVAREGGKAMLKDGNVEMAVPERFANSLAAEGADGALTAGIRPEHFEIGDGAGTGNAATMRATVEVVEFLGNEELIHMRVGEHDLVAIVDASHRVRPGDVVDMYVPVEKIHLFDQAEGKALRM
jgi:multiple sugar transport system ATP-binding protein